MDTTENIYTISPESSQDEIFMDLLKRDNIHIEKIISYGQTTPLDNPYVQNYNEWVLVLIGTAKIKLANKEYMLNQGEYLFLPKNIEHWVTYTSDPTVWLAIYFKE